MSERVKRLARAIFRGPVDGLMSRRNGPWLVAGFVVLVLLWAVGAGWVVGRLHFGAETVGPLPVEVDGGASQGVQDIASELLLSTGDGTPADGPPPLDAPDARAWLDDRVCLATYPEAQERAARAWRLRTWPGLCRTPVDWVQASPLTIWLGWPAGVAGIIAVLALGWLLVLGAFRFRDHRDGYHRLFGALHHQERTRKAP